MNTEERQVSRMLQWLAPWVEKTDGEELTGDWEQTLPTTMMLKLLNLWLSENSREEVERMMQLYHPIDRAAMAYALVVWVMTGRKMTFRSAVATQHFKRACQIIKEDMPQLMFAGHIKYMAYKYGPKKEKK